jgi:hypothetical protein
MTSACRKFCLETVQLSEKLLQLTHDGHADCEDDRCLLLLGIILDSASKIRLEAEIRLKILAEEGSKHGAKNRGLPFRIERPRNRT